MKYDDIEYELKISPALKLLRSENISLIISFLYREFKVRLQISISQLQLETNLGDYLESLREDNPECYPRSPKEYLNRWCDENLLRKTFSKEDDPIFTLTPDAEKAIMWLEDLQKKEAFIGTESRFLQIFDLLKEIQDRSTTDVETRIEQLERDRDSIQAEIDSIRETGVVERYDSTRIQERFIGANQMIRQLIADFQAIEQNFRNLTRKVQEAQFEKDSRKGTVIGRVLDADQELSDSDQGRSFYTFWKFLMSETKRQELKSLIQGIYQLEELQTLAQEYPLLRRIERSLLDAGEHIVKSNHRLTEKLRQMLDERNLQENRRVAELIIDIQRLALQVTKENSIESDFWMLEGKPLINLVMTRPLHPLEQSEVQTFSLDFNNLSEITLDEELTELYQQFYVDEEILKQRISQSLEHVSNITLKNLLALYPVTQGLPEVASYLAIATQSDRHRIEYATIDTIEIASLEPEARLQLTLPQIIFCH